MSNVIKTQRLILRPFEPRDELAYTSIRAKPENVRFLPGGEATAEQAEEIAPRQVASFAALWQGEPGFGPWAAEERLTGELIGHVGLRRLPDLGGETEVLYLVDSSRWGLGYATEGAAAALEFGFRLLNLSNIIAMALPENGASIRVMEKVGMRRESGLFRAFGLDLVRYSLSKES